KMKPSRKFGAIGASLALAMTSLVAAMPAGAEAFPIDAPLSGGITLYPAEGEPTQLPMTDGSNFTGSYDNESGVVSGNVQLAPGAAEVDTGLIGIADLFFEFVDEGDIVDGTLDAEGN